MQKRHLSMLMMVFILLASGIVNAESYRDAFQYLSPKPNAKLVNKGSYIIIRPGDNLSHYSFDRNDPVYIEGEQSGKHSYDVKTALDNKTLNIVPHTAFEPGERVAIVIDNGLKSRGSDRSKDFKYEFTVSPKQEYQTYDNPSLTLEVESNNLHNDDFNDVILNDDPNYPSDFPNIWTDVVGSPAPGYIFSGYAMNTFMPSGYALIMENDGTPVFMRKIEGQAWDFKKQDNGLLTYMTNSYFDPNHISRAFIMDQTYTVRDSFEMVGYELDIHDCKIDDDFHIHLGCYDVQIVDLSDSIAGGDSLCQVTGFVHQELDSLGNVVMEWRSWDYISIFDGNDLDFTGARLDYCHWNATDIDNDGNLLFSFRNSDEIIKVDRNTGDILWRLGAHAQNNMFTIVDDSSGFCKQHGVTFMDNGNIAIFDNGNCHTPAFSRAVEYELDEVNYICTQVWEFRHNPDLSSPFMGSVQRLANGNTLIGWGGNAAMDMTEVASDGSVVTELDFDTTRVSNTYRFKKFPWTGIASRPDLLAEQTDQGIHLMFNQWGDMAITDYIIYMDDSPEPTTILDTTTQNYYFLTDLSYGVTYNFRVTGVDYVGIEGNYSNEVSISMPNLYMPGDVNGDEVVIGADVTVLVNYFRGMAVPVDSCWNADESEWLYAAADVNGDCIVIGADVTYLVNYFRAINSITWCEDTPPYGY